MTESPPKLWAFWGLALNVDEIDTDPMLYAYESETTAHGAQEVDKSHDEDGIVSPVQAYVREDVAAAREAAAEAKYKNRDVEVMRVALADLRRIRGCLATRANTLRTIGEEDRAKGLEDAIKQLDEEVFT